MSSVIPIFDKVLEEFKPAYAKMYDATEPLAHGVKSEDVNSLIDMYIRLENLKEMCEGLIKACNIHQPEIAELASKAMLATDTEAVVRSGFTIRPDTKTYVSVNKDNKPAVLQWLKSHPSGRELVSEDYNANAFSSYIRGLIQEQGWDKNAEDPDKRIPAEVSVFDKAVLTLRRNRK